MRNHQQKLPGGEGVNYFYKALSLILFTFDRFRFSPVRTGSGCLKSTEFQNIRVIQLCLQFWLKIVWILLKRRFSCRLGKKGIICVYGTVALNTELHF